MEEKQRSVDAMPAGSGFSFSSALVHLKDGGFVARQGWNGKNMYLFLIGVDPTDRTLGYWTYTNGKNDNSALRPFIAMMTAQGDVVPWLASQSDLLSDDWVCVSLE